MNDYPLVTIAVATYNSATTIQETLDSIYKQTYSNIELIISDDSSQDNTLSIVREWIDINKGRFKNVLLLESAYNHGTCFNLNKAIKNASGKWIKFIGGDDSLMPSCIENNINYIAKNPSIQILSSKSRDYLDYLDDEHEENNTDFYERVKHIYQLESIDQIYYLAREYTISSPTLFFKVEILKKYGGFDEEYFILEDAPLILKMLENGIECRFMDIYTVKYRKRGKPVRLYNESLLRYRRLYAQNLRFKYLSRYERFSYWLKYFFIFLFCKLGLNHNNILCRLLHMFFYSFVNLIASKNIHV